MTTTCARATTKHVRKLLIITVFASLLVSMFVENCRSHAKDSREERIDNMVRIVYCTKDLPAGSILNEDCLKRTVIEKMNRPADAVYDTWIVIGRSTKNFLKKGNPIRFQDVFPQELLTDAIVRYIENQQGQTLMYPARLDRDPRTLVPIARSVRDIPEGATIMPSDFIIEQIEEQKCPGQALGDLWIAAGRTAVHPITAHDYVYYHQVIPKVNWNRWQFGTSE